MQFLKGMKEYYISTGSFSNGSHVVHRHECPLLPEPGKRIFLGAFRSPGDALKEGMKHFGEPVCCRFCSNDENQRKVNAESDVRAGTGFISYDRLKPTIESLMLCSVS
jgi:hypothetical protein